MASTTLTPPAALASAPAGAMLALDLATTTGWALRSADGQILSATVSFKPSRYDGGGIRYLRFRAWLESMAQNVGCISAVYHEAIRRHV
jgi:hypothetical protein